jgi:hypothetical protein
MMLFLRQNLGTSRVSWVPKPSQIDTRGLPLARSLVSGLKMRLSYSRLM